MTRQEKLIARVGEAMAGEDKVRALLVGGSFGRGTADGYSDVDFIAVAAADDHAAVAARWRDVLGGLVPVVFWQEWKGVRGTILNAVDADWLRCDLLVVTADRLGGYSQDAIRVIHDRDGIFGTLPASLPARTPDRARVAALIDEFIRVLGLVPVVVGREEYVTSVFGVGLQRDHLTKLLLEEVADPHPGGVLHLSKVLTPEQMRLLSDLPYPRPERDAVIAAHIEMARVFLPRARVLGDRLGIAWPEAFEVATRRHLARAFGDGIDLDW